MHARLGRAEDVKIEEKVSSQRAVDYRHLEEKARKGGEALLRELQGILAEKGRCRIRSIGSIRGIAESKTHHPAYSQKHRPADGDYGTVVVGRQSFSGLKCWFGHHVSEELIRAEKKIAIWVVE